MRKRPKPAHARRKPTQPGRARIAVLGGSLMLTLVIAAASLIWPFDDRGEANQSGEDSVALSAILPTITPPSRGAAARTRPLAQPVEPTTFPASGPNTFRVATPIPVVGSNRGQPVTYTVEVENGLRHDPNLVSKQISEVLGNERGWRSKGSTFKQVSKNPAVRILLASPATVDRNCYPLMTYGEVSCRSGNRVVLNVKRWTLGAESYGKDIANYRRYLVNHEVGHALGQGHVYCPGPGQPAPLMMQQTKGLEGCVANPWP